MLLRWQRAVACQTVDRRVEELPEKVWQCSGDLAVLSLLTMDYSRALLRELNLRLVGLLHTIHLPLCGAGAVACVLRPAGEDRSLIVIALGIEKLCEADYAAYAIIAAMQSSDLLLAGRKRAGLSQTQLAERLGRPQATIARWEKGRQHPPLETVVEVLHACGLELTVGMARYDDSYQSQIVRQLRLDPPERVRRLAPSWAAEGFDPLGVLKELAGRARFVVVGDVAGVLNGWPVMLGSRTVQIVPAGSTTHRIEQVVRRLGAECIDENSDEQTCWRLSDGGELRVTPDVAGTGGYRDLTRDAQPTQIAPGMVVRVASLIDLIRVAEASPDPDGRVHVPALWATLAERRRRDTAAVAA